MILGIDASTPGSGGAKRHLIELLAYFEPEKHGFTKVKIWGVNETLSLLPNSVYIEKLSHTYLNRGFLHRIYWQLFFRDNAFKNQFDVLFSPFGTYSGGIKPYVSMSRNMLVFDRTEQKRFGLSWMRIKMKLLYYTQKKSFKNAQGLIFLSEHAKNLIETMILPKTIKSTIIHHGVSDSFRFTTKVQHPISTYTFDHPFKWLYVSTIWPYKHPWNVVAAISGLRNKKYPVSLTIVGNVEHKRSGKKLNKAILMHDPDAEFVTWHKKVELDQVSVHYRDSEAFVFASTCENMPNILVEAMASGLPIACSSYRPMPEFLKDAGLYFDPTNIKEIELALEKMFLDHKLRRILSSTSYEYVSKFDWNKCADETFLFLRQTRNESINNQNVQK